MALGKRGLAAGAALVGLLVGCGGDGTGPGTDGSGTVELAFVPGKVALGTDATARVLLENRGTRSARSIELHAGDVARGDGAVVGARLQVVPTEISQLEAGGAVTISVSLVFTAPPAAGDYQATLAALLEDDTVSAVTVTFAVAGLPAGEATAIEIIGGSSTVRQGDVVAYVAEARDAAGEVISDPSLSWSVVPAAAGLILGDGRFVGYSSGSVRIVAAAGAVADTMEVTVDARGLGGAFLPVGRGEVTSRYTSDLWVHGDFAYTGTWNCRSGNCGDRMHVWNVSDPSAPAHTDSVVVDARTVNDVKIRADGTLGVLTHEGSIDGLNGITLFDLSDPAHPSVISRVTEGDLSSGVHNVWIEGDYVYVAVDGPGMGLRVVDISNPASPSVIASFWAGSSFLHDVYVRDGLAFLSHWNAGLIILDVGNGIAGGSPANPVEVSRIETAGGQVHNAWYWPGAGYVFVGEEDFGTPGIVHVVDASDLRHPEEVASFRVPGTTPHNFWVDETRNILYVGWYGAGLRAVDVSGVLLGELERQGREIAGIQYGDGSGCQISGATCAWAPQLHNGLIYVSDMNTGLWIFEPQF